MDTRKVYEGPFMAPFTLQVPNSEYSVTVTHERWPNGIGYTIENSDRYGPRSSYGRDSIREAFDTMVDTLKWHARVRDHGANGHKEIIVSLCEECEA